MNLIKHVFKPNPEKLKRKNQKKIYKLLYEFTESSEISSLFFSDKTFRTKTFWENTTLVIPKLFQNWLKDRKIEVAEKNNTYKALDNEFEWKMTTYKFDEFHNYFVGYQFQLNPQSEVKNETFKYEIYHLLIEIERGYPKHMDKIYFDHTSQKVEGISIVERISRSNLNEDLIRQKLSERLEFSERFKTNEIVLRTSLAKYNPLLTAIKKEAEMHFREIAENSLRELAKQNIPLEGIPFKNKLDESAAHLSEILFDDYDFYVNHLEKKDLERAIQSVKNKIIKQYLSL